ncbi:MAG: hypothetical protein ACLFUJ_02545 [Phycisphaerae bacterium]
MGEKIERRVWLRRWPGVLSILAGLGLGMLMFLPWLVTAWRAEVKQTDETQLLQASGWQLSRGQVRAIAEERLDDPHQPRRWVLLGLAVPLGLLVVGGLTLIGTLPRRWGGRLMVILGLGGVAVMLIAGFAISLPAGPLPAETDLPDAAEAYQAHRIRRQQVRQMLTTQPTRLLWLALGIYAVVVAGGAISSYSAGAGQRPVTQPHHSEIQPHRKQPYPAGDETS